MQSNMASPFMDTAEVLSAPFMDYLDAASDFGSHAFEDAMGGVSVFGHAGATLTRTQSDLFPSDQPSSLKNDMNIPSPLQVSLATMHPDDLTVSLEGSSSNTSSSSHASLNKLARDITPLTHAQPQGQSSGDSDSEHGDHARVHESTSEKPDHSASSDTTKHASPPCTPQQTGNHLPDLASGPISNASPTQESVQQMQHLHLNSLQSSPMPMKNVESWSEAYAQTPLISPIHNLVPTSWPMLGLQLGTQNPFTAVGMQDRSMLDLSGMQPSAYQPFVEPPRTQGGTMSPRDSVVGDRGLWPPNMTPQDSTAMMQSVSMMSSTHTKNVSPGRRRANAVCLPRKAQSTPHFQKISYEAVPLPTTAQSPSKSRSTPKTVRRLTSQKRMSVQPTAIVAEPTKMQPGRLRMRGSMAALREANAMQLSSKNATQSTQGVRKPITLSFVNYGIEDAEELCSAVAPSGSYKVPLRGFKDSDEEGDDQAATPPATRSPPDGPSESPAMPHGQASPHPGTTVDAAAPPSEPKLRRATTNLRDFCRT